MVAALVNDRIAGPSLVDFGQVERGQGAKRQTLIERRDRVDGMPVARLVSPYPWLKVREASRDPRRLGLELEVAPEAPPGPFAGTVLVLLDDPSQPVVEVPVTGRVRSLVAPSPPVILLPQSAAAGQVVGEVRCARALRGATLSAPGLTLRVEGQRVVLLAGEALPTAPLTLVLETEVAGEERVEVPVLPR